MFAHDLACAMIQHPETIRTPRSVENSTIPRWILIARYEPDLHHGTKEIVESVINLAMGLFEICVLQQMRPFNLYLLGTPDDAELLTRPYSRP